ncbi:hypothetical protein J1N35_007007 [Gossypium stocksii]|uniref:CCHC-type domain-containing protein n=1 Tax=Gossypium stocksii TaxID=47602 RepID=A0A9D3W5N7_9ROSI|nr:hypothetical protein J1N35_007007 [Gossypium stocksii]
MEESDGDDREGRDEISLLAEELIQLSVKGSMVVPSAKPSLICTIWTEKFYNPESFRAQMKKFDKKDLLHAIGVTFGGVIRYEISANTCRLRINLDVQKPLPQGIFVSIDNIKRSWVPFKYEKLPMFCFGCGRMGHGFQDCLQIPPAEKNKIREDPPYTLALKVESKLIGNECMKFNVLSKKVGA